MTSRRSARRPSRPSTRRPDPLTTATQMAGRHPPARHPHVHRRSRRAAPRSSRSVLLLVPSGALLGTVAAGVGPRVIGDHVLLGIRSRALVRRDEPGRSGFRAGRAVRRLLGLLAGQPPVEGFTLALLVRSSSVLVDGQRLVARHRLLLRVAGPLLLRGAVLHVRDALVLERGLGITTWLAHGVSSSRGGQSAVTVRTDALRGPGRAPGPHRRSWRTTVREALPARRPRPRARPRRGRAPPGPAAWPGIRLPPGPGPSRCVPRHPPASSRAAPRPAARSPVRSDHDRCRYQRARGP